MAPQYTGAMRWGEAAAPEGIACRLRRPRRPVFSVIMEIRISATDLSRRLGDILGRIRYRGESFLIERNGTPVARLVPVMDAGPATVRQALAAWRNAAEPEPAFADALGEVNALDRPPGDAWGS